MSMRIAAIAWTGAWVAVLALVAPSQHGDAAGAGRHGGSAAGSRPSGTESRPAEPAQGESRPASRPDYGDVPAGSKDPVVDGLRSIIREMILKGLAEDQPGRLADRVLAILERAGLGEEGRRKVEAEATARTLLSAQEEFRPKGPAKKVLTQDDEARVRAAAQALAKDLSIKLQPIVLPKHATGQHTILRAAPDMKLPPGFEPVAWKTLGGFEYKEGMTLPDDVRKLDGRKVGMTGYMMTIEEVENIHEFLLVEAFWSCCFGTPPTVNQVLLVRVEGKGVEYTSSPVLILGTLEVGEQIEDGFVTSVYRIKATSVAATE